MSPTDLIVFSFGPGAWDGSSTVIQAATPGSSIVLWRWGMHGDVGGIVTIAADLAVERVPVPAASELVQSCGPVALKCPIGQLLRITSAVITWTAFSAFFVYSIEVG